MIAREPPGFIRALYRLLRVDGNDISDVGTLQSEGERHGFDAARLCPPKASLVDHLLTEWADQWAATEHSGVPLLERADRVILVGLVSVEQVRRFLSIT